MYVYIHIYIYIYIYIYTYKQHDKFNDIICTMYSCLLVDVLHDLIHNASHIKPYKYDCTLSISIEAINRCGELGGRKRTCSGELRGK